jgi:peptidoglycan/LPS O-acetylase OafA/YrhL
MILIGLVLLLLGLIGAFSLSRSITKPLDSLTHAASLVGIEGLTARVAAFGGYGVQLFFVVSGFTIFLVYQKGLAAQKHPAANFFTRRLFRIVPIYWAGIVLYSAVYGLGSRGWQPGPELWHIPLHICCNCTLPPRVLSFRWMVDQLRCCST